jgi:gamma-glutamylcyclotransferase (GGCT)/AIG2-like uncharacterized protein YtfP
MAKRNKKYRLKRDKTSGGNSRLLVVRRTGKVLGKVEIDQSTGGYWIQWRISSKGIPAHDTAVERRRYKNLNDAAEALKTRGPKLMTLSKDVDPTNFKVYAKPYEKVLYFAFGSNLDVKQMKRRCPSMKIVANASVSGYKIAFRGYSIRSGGGTATLVKNTKSVSPGVIYQITRDDLWSLDRCEGHPHVYRRTLMTVTTETGEQVETFTYLMPEKDLLVSCPSVTYFNRIDRGYGKHKLPDENLNRALEEVLDHPEPEVVRFPNSNRTDDRRWEHVMEREDARWDRMFSDDERQDWIDDEAWWREHGYHFNGELLDDPDELDWIDDEDGFRHTFMQRLRGRQRSSGRHGQP